ncbi:hypothetical protein GNF80_16625 [Clostridium perfringens]|nr:hypothetical protein [Clostridium perfringens]
MKTYLDESGNTGNVITKDNILKRNFTSRCESGCKEFSETLKISKNL